MKAPQAYPLQWPHGWPKTEKPEGSRFQTKLNTALQQLKDEVLRIGGKGLVLSSNVTLDQTNPKEAGVVAYFARDGAQIAIPCDRWNKVQDNVRAIALTLEAMRGMERWGAKNMITAMFSGFAALPAPGSSATPWWEILGVERTATEEQIKTARRVKLQKYHPDKQTHDSVQYRLVETAYIDAMRQIGALA